MSYAPGRPPMDELPARCLRRLWPKAEEVHALNTVVAKLQGMLAVALCTAAHVP